MGTRWSAHGSIRSARVGYAAPVDASLGVWDLHVFEPFAGSPRQTRRSPLERVGSSVASKQAVADEAKTGDY
jgi:hypothetical protein